MVEPRQPGWSTPSATAGAAVPVTDEQWAFVEVGRDDARLRILGALAPVGIFEADVGGRFVWVNAHWERLFGSTLSLAGDLGWERAVHEDDRRRVVAEWRRAVSTGEELSTEFRLRGSDSAAVWVACRAATLRDPEGVVLGYLGTVTDVTPRIVAQRELAESEQRYRALADNSTDMIMRTAPDGTVLYASPACRAMLGYEPEDLVGRATPDLVHEDDLKALAELRDGDGGLTTRELRMLHHNGHWVWTENVVVVLRSPDGLVIERYGSARSIQGRKCDELVLRESLGRYRALAENYPGGAVFLFDGDLRYQVAAGPALVSLGIDAAAVEGKRPEEAFPGKLGLRIAGWFGDALEGTARAWREYAAPGARGRVYDVRIGPVLEADGAVIAGMAILEDVTDQARAEEEQSAIHAITEAVARSATLAEILEVAAVAVASLLRAELAAITGSTRRRAVPC